MRRTASIGALTGALVFACGGRVDTSSAPSEASRSSSSAEDPSRESREAQDESRPRQAAPPSDSATGSGGDCSSLGATCQVFEPGGPERWGCSTLGTDPELACEHAAGAAIARCNCSGRFGEGEPAASPDAGPPPSIEWFDVPATSTPFTNAYVIDLWKQHCNGRCVPR